MFVESLYGIVPKPTTAADHHLDLHQLLSPAAQSSRDREQADRAPDVPARGGSHPMPKRTRRNAQLLLSSSRVNHNFSMSAEFFGSTGLDADRRIGSRGVRVVPRDWGGFERAPLVL